MRFCVVLLDELPQFFNVIQGSMSIVGPRPHAVAHNEQYRSLVERYMLRHKVKPGITGLAQINGFRGETDTLDKMEMRVKFDLKYIQYWSLGLDLKIIFLTLFKVCRCIRLLASFAPDCCSPPFSPRRGHTRIPSGRLVWKSRPRWRAVTATTATCCGSVTMVRRLAPISSG